MREQARELLGGRRRKGPWRHIASKPAPSPRPRRTDGDRFQIHRTVRNGEAVYILVSPEGNAYTFSSEQDAKAKLEQILRQG